MKVSYFIRDNGACGYYRMKLPIETMTSMNGTKSMKITKGDKADHVLKALDADIIVIPRLGETELLEAVLKVKNMGKKIVVDHDDNMFCISPLSPHYEEAGIENVKYKMPDGSTLDVWTDGKNIDLKRNKIRQENFKKALKMADMVTTTTEILAGIYRGYNSNVQVLPNCVDVNLWKKLPFEKRDDIRICWFGGSSHYEDWLILQDVLPIIMDRYPKVTLVLMGAKFDGTIKKLPKERLEFHQWIHTEAYPYKAAILDCDISLIPLVDNGFNRCKSSIKWVEQSALGIPSITSHVSPYKEVATETNGIFIENNLKEAWVKGISMLIEDPVLRGKIGGEAYRTVLKHFDINTQWVKWESAYRSLL